MDVMVASFHPAPYMQNRPKSRAWHKPCSASVPSFCHRRKDIASSASLPNEKPQLSILKHFQPLNSQPSSSQPTHRSFLALPMAVVVGLALVLQPVGSPPAQAFGWFEFPPAIEKDPVEPFTLYGSVFKKYFIEKIVDGKVVSRKKGFTSKACVNALDANKETPELQGVPAGLKVVIIGDPVCAKSEGQSRDETCIPSCKTACTRAISRHLAEVKEQTGYVLDSKDTRKVMDSCSNQCANECSKPGKTISFIYPFRPSK